MALPHVVFKPLSLRRETEIISNFLLEGGPEWSKYVTRCHPQLRRALTLATKRERLAFVRTYVDEYRTRHAKRLKNRQDAFERDWQKVEQRFFTRLADILETDWPKRRSHITASVSINPICPRFLDEWSFTISMNAERSRAREIIMHECVHFLYFKKWAEIYPNADRRTFESPHIVWELSELIAPIILNDPHINAMLRGRAQFYSYHRRVRIEQMTAPAYFAKRYRQRKNFDAFLRTSYQIIKRHKRAFRKAQNA